MYTASALYNRDFISDVEDSSRTLMSDSSCALYQSMFNNARPLLDLRITSRVTYIHPDRGGLSKPETKHHFLIHVMQHMKWNTHQSIEDGPWNGNLTSEVGRDGFYPQLLSRCFDHLKLEPMDGRVLSKRSQYFPLRGIRAELLVSSRATASPTETVPDSWLSILMRSSSGLMCANLCVRARRVEATRLCGSGEPLA